MTPEQFAYDLIRTISKTGELDLVSPDSLDWASSLDDSEKVALYCRVRDESHRPEEEWRDEFIDVVDIDEGLLPDSQF